MTVSVLLEGVLKEGEVENLLHFAKKPIKLLGPMMVVMELI